MKLRFTLAVIKAYHSSADGSAFFVGLLCNSSVKLLIFVTVDGICALLDNLICGKLYIVFVRGLLDSLTKI